MKKHKMSKQGVTGFAVEIVKLAAAMITLIKALL